jgi:hypothetical protein
MRRTILLIVIASGCAHSPEHATQPAIDVKPTAATSIRVVPNAVPDTAPARFKRTEILPGCFAWSPSRQKVACFVGNWSTMTSDTGGAMLVMLTTDDRQETPIFDNAPNEVPEGLRSALDAELVAGRYVELPGRRKLTAGVRVVVAGFSVLMKRGQVSEGGENSAPEADVELVIQYANRPPSIDDHLHTVPCAEPEAFVTDLPGFGLLVERICKLADEGYYGTAAAAWVCSDTDCR